MWHMNSGHRVFTEAEWNLFATGLDILRFDIEDDVEYDANNSDTGVPVFDRLTPEQKLALLADTAIALRDPAVPPPPHTAANEGAIMAVFSTLRSELEVELDESRMADGDSPTEIRRLLRAACDGPEDQEEPLPELKSIDRDAWEWLAEEVVERVLWDYDFDMGDEFLDLPPDEARAMLRHMRVDPEYFLTVPAEPGERGLIAARQTLARLIGLAVPDDDGLYPTLIDRYHGLEVGPVSVEDRSAWESNPWIEAGRKTEPGWDCDYKTWAAELGRAVPADPFEVGPVPPGAVRELPQWVRVERHEGSWVVRDEDGAYWCGLIDNCWIDDLEDDDIPALSFPTEAEATAAFAQANRMYDERTARRETALAKLGLPEEV